MSKQREYRVTWQIELSASSFEEAASLALDIHRDVDSEAVAFDVERLKDGKIKCVDLINEI